MFSSATGDHEWGDNDHCKNSQKQSKENTGVKVYTGGKFMLRLKSTVVSMVLIVIIMIFFTAPSFADNYAELRAIATPAKKTMNNR